MGKHKFVIHPYERMILTYCKVGVSRQTINSIEACQYIPSTVLALKIARYFGKPTDSIFSLEEND